LWQESLVCCSTLRHDYWWLITGKNTQLLPRELRQYTNRNLFIVLAAVIAVALIATAATVYAITALLVYRAGAQNHNNTRVGLEMLLTSLSDAETGQRGYLLTGDEAYLTPYSQAIKQIPIQLATLNDGTLNATQAAQVGKITSLTHDKLAELRQTIALRQSGDIAGAQALVVTGTGQTLMNQIRTLTSQVQAEEAMQLDHDRAQVSNLGNLARDISIISLAATLALMLLVYWIYVKAIKSERRLDQAKDEFVALASHQLRTPATGIKSILSTLVSGDFGPLNEKQTYFMNRALQSNERELGIIEELLNVAKADAGRLVMHSTDVELSKLIDVIVGEQHAAIDKKGQNLALNLPARPLTIVADEEKL
jgi:two-component system cell cycle sensor histidine kinase PleC